MGIFFAFLSAFLFAVNNILIKKGMKISKDKDDDGVFTTIFLNVIIFAIFFVFYRSFFYTQHVSFSWIGLLYFIFAGLLTNFLGRITFFKGIKRIGPSKAAPIKNSAPIFTVIFAIGILHEKIDTVSWLGILLIIFGICIQGYSMFKQGKNTNDKFGLMFSLASSISFGVGQGTRKQGLKYLNDPFAGALIGASVALISFIILAAFRRNLLKMLKLTFLHRNIFYYLGGIATGFATLFFFMGIWFTNVAFVGTIVATDPILTVILSKIFLKGEEKIGLTIIIATVFIFIGAAVIALTA